jgi:hypothetical protein
MPGPEDVIPQQHPQGPWRLRCRHLLLEKLQAVAAAYETVAGPWGQDPAPPSSRQHGSTSASCVHPSCNEDVPVKTIQIGTDAAETTRITGDLDSK